MDLSTRDFYPVEARGEAIDDQAETASLASDQISLASTVAARQANQAAFNKLRTAVDVKHTESPFFVERSDGIGALPGNEPERLPSTKQGDWRAFAKVDARFVILPHGAISRSGSNAKGAKIEASGPETEWLCEQGTLWVQEGKILFVLDPVTPPQAAPIAVPRGKHFTLKRRFGQSPPSPTTDNDGSDSPKHSLSMTRSRSGSRSLRLSRSRTSERSAGEDLSPPDSPEVKLSGHRSISRAIADVFRSPRDDVRAASPPRDETSPSSDWPAFIGSQPLTAIRIDAEHNLLAIRSFPAKTGSSLFHLLKGASSPPASPALSRTTTRDAAIDGRTEIVTPARVELDCAGATGHEALVSFEFTSKGMFYDEWTHFAEYVKVLRERGLGSSA